MIYYVSCNVVFFMTESTIVFIVQGNPGNVRVSGSQCLGGGIVLIDRYFTGGLRPLNVN